MVAHPYKIKAEYVFRADPITKRSGRGPRITYSPEVFFECDPTLNTRCSKKDCGDCRHTREMKFAKKYELRDKN